MIAQFSYLLEHVQSKEGNKYIKDDIHELILNDDKYDVTKLSYVYFELPVSPIKHNNTINLTIVLT
jgi:hypothetical protein